MNYDHILSAVFLERPNRFTALVSLPSSSSGKTAVCHVKNTGRCRELLIPGTSVLIEHHLMRFRRAGKQSTPSSASIKSAPAGTGRRFSSTWTHRLLIRQPLNGCARAAWAPFPMSNGRLGSAAHGLISLFVRMILLFYGSQGSDS